MTRLSIFGCLSLLLYAAATGALGAPAQPAALPASPVTDIYFGVQVTDRWRGMEGLDAATMGWLRGQGAYARERLDAIAPRAALATKIATASAAVAQIWGVQTAGGRMFWLQRGGNAQSASLMARASGGGTRLLFDPETLGAGSAINYFRASPDGGRVALEVASEGDEDNRLVVIDGHTGSQVAGPIDRVNGKFSWTDDGDTLFLQRLQKTDDPKLRRLNMTAQSWDLHGDPVDVLGVADGRSIPVAAARRPSIVITPGSGTALAEVTDGVGADLELWTAPTAEAAAPHAAWRPLTAWSDGVTAVTVSGADIYLLTHQNAPTFAVLHVAAGQPLARAETLVPARADRVIDWIQAASGGLWVMAREGLYSKLLFVPRGGTPREVGLPGRGSIGELFADPRFPGAVIEFGSWTDPDALYATRGPDSAFESRKVSLNGGYDPALYASEELQAVASDGVRIPLTLISKRGAATPGIVRMGGYGAYGAALTPAFDPRRTPFLDEGGTVAICHVRGGGELGEDWHLAGKGAKKPNTWRDFIACAKTLVAKGVTTPGKLVVDSASAGGIMVGRAMEEAPALFAGVIAEAPAVNMLRAQTMPGGAANAPEFGSTADEAGFRNLLAMDTLAHVETGVAYPAVMITTSLNDPRVPPWQGGELAAALMASGSKKPVLLRVEETGGHDTGASKSHDDALEADADAFAFWVAGRPGWSPE